MLTFTRHFTDRTDQITMTAQALIVAGWTGRDEAALQHHIDELAAIGALTDGLWIGLGSDHTDRKAETMGIALSKQLCGKVLGDALWKFEDIAPHWDNI